MTKLIIQIPCLNEESTLPITVAALPRGVEGVDVGQPFGSGVRLGLGVGVVPGRAVAYDSRAPGGDTGLAVGAGALRQVNGCG